MRILIFILFLIIPLFLNAQVPSNCSIKGGVIDKVDHRPNVTIYNSDGSKQIFSYHDIHNDSCGRNVSILTNDNNFTLKKNRLYVICFSTEPTNNSQILSIEEELKIKVKARQKDDTTEVKALINCDMKEDSHLYTMFGKTKKFDYYSEYINHIESFFDTTKVLDMYTSPNLSKNTLLKFNLYKAFEVNKVKFAITNNKSLKRTFIKNNQQTESIVVSSNKKMQAVFKAKSQDAAIEKMYGPIKEFKEGNITIQSPNVAANGNAVPLGMISDIDAESILVLTDSTWYPAVFAIISTPYNKIDYHVKLNLNYKEVWKYTITVIIKDKKGNFYKAKNNSDVVHYTSCS